MGIAIFWEPKLLLLDVFEQEQRNKKLKIIPGNV
jgi:hypothetical protein